MKTHLLLIAFLTIILPLSLSGQQVTPPGGGASDIDKTLFRATTCDTQAGTYIGESKHNKLLYHIIDMNGRKEAALLGWVDSYDYTPDIVIPDVIPFQGENVPVVTIADNAFINGWGITGLKIGANVNVIGLGSFAGTAIKKVSIPENVRYILDAAFNASRLESVTFENASSTAVPLVIGAYAFAYNNIVTFEVPARLHINDENSFTRKYQNFLMANMPLKQITVNPAFSTVSRQYRYDIIDNALCSVTDSDEGPSVRVICFPSSCGDTGFELTAGYIDIYNDAFCGTSIRTVRLNATYPVREDKVNLVLGSGAFASSQLAQLDLTANGPIKLTETFSRYCNNLKAYNLSESITNFKVFDGIIYAKKQGERYLVAYPAGLQQSRFVVPDDVVGIAANAFNANQYVEEIVFPEGLKVIEPYACVDLVTLSGLVIPSTVDNIGRYAFYTSQPIKGEIQIKRSTPPTGTSDETPDFDIFNPRTLAETTLVIPDGAAATDFTAYSGWAFANIVTRDFGVVDDIAADDMSISVSGNTVASSDGTVLEVDRSDGALVGRGPSVVLTPRGMYIVRCGAVVKKIRL